MSMRQAASAWRQAIGLVLGVAVLSLGMAVSAAAQPAEPVIGCIPISERAGRPYGCFVLGAVPVGPLTPSAAFWHLETFPTVAAASQAKGARGAVFEAFDKVWVLTIAESGWRSRGGTHVAEIGPLPIASGVGYTATFMEGTFTPGMKARSTCIRGRRPGARCRAKRVSRRRAARRWVAPAARPSSCRRGRRWS